MTKIRIKKEIQAWGDVRYYIQVRFLLFFWKKLDWEDSLDSAVKKAIKLAHTLRGKQTLSLEEAQEIVGSQKEDKAE